MTEPEAPQHVRLQYADGSTSDELQVSYLGLDNDGLHTWEALAPDARRPRAVLVSAMPGRSAILVGWLKGPRNDGTRRQA